jgi:hypothetical protein
MLVVAAALGAGSLGDKRPAGCASRHSCVGLRLPAPITIVAGRVLGSVAYRIGRDGSARRIPRIPSPVPPRADVFPATGTWFTFQHGHLVVGRGGKRLWRSHGEIARNQLGVIMANPGMVAFQHDHELYLAALGGAERPVASREMPLGWTRRGLYTYSYQGRRLLLRSDTGTLVKTIASRPLGSDYFVADGSLYFISRGVVMSAHGTRIRRLASLRSIGMSDAWFQPAGRLVQLQDNSRLVVLRPDGSVFAWTPLPREAGQIESISSSTVFVAPDASAIAFTATASATDSADAADRAYGTETVYLLRPGAHAAVPVRRERVAFNLCEGGARLQWHGKWLLYSNSEGNLAAIDASGAYHAIELGGLVRGLRGTRDGFSASWSGQLSSLW